MSDLQQARPGGTPHSPVAVVLLNWRAPEMTLAAVDRVFQQTSVPHHVFVVENGSGDDSPRLLAEGLARYEDRITLLINKTNLGFGGGCNTALREVLVRGFEWVWLLNNDAEPAPNCLTALLSAASAPRYSDRRPGLIGTLMIDPSVPDDAHYGSWMHPVTLITRSLCREEDFARHRFSWMTAASLLVSADALRTIGLFDERFFMYWEDADLNMRIRAAGYAVIAAADARANHAAGTSSKGMETQRYLWHFASQRRFLRKHHRAKSLGGLWLRLKYLLKAGWDRDRKRAKALLRW